MRECWSQHPYFVFILTLNILIDILAFNSGLDHIKSKL